MYEEKEIKYQKRKKEKKTMPKETKIEKEKKTKEQGKKQPISLPPVLKKIDFQKLFTELAILIFVMMLIIFTLSRIKKQQQKLTETFKENMTSITNTALHYFEEKTLPQNTGDSTSILLEEMINLNLISEIKDEDNNPCNAMDSYILLTKTTKEDYRLKIYLKCPKKEQTLEQKVTCHNKVCNLKK